MAAVTIRPRDVTFTFTDSCNCCMTCFGRKTMCSKDDDVYVNSNGNLEKFKESKAKENVEGAFERSKGHLHGSLKKRLSLLDMEPSEFNERTRGVLESMDVLGKIKLAHIDSINDLMMEYLLAKAMER